MLELMKKYYEEETAIENAFDSAKEKFDGAGMEAAREERRRWVESVKAEGKDFRDVYRLFSEAQDRGNEYIDFNEVIYYKNPSEMIEKMRKAGIQKFTFSSTWSNAIETSWMFIENGCKLEGIIQINGTCTKFMSDEREKIPAYVFSIT